MSRKSGEKKDRTSLVISLVLHLIIIGAVGYWAYKSGVAEKIARRILGIVRTEKPQEKPQQQQVQQKPPPQLPKINEGLPPPPSTGTRRAVAQDAPAAAADTFFQDTRKQVQGPGGPSGTSTQKVEAPRVIAPPPKPILPPMRAAGPSTITQLLAERAKAVAATEAVGSEQISKAGASDAGGAVTKVAGATIVGGKFAVIRGLNDRYITTTLNGGSIPSADPYRQSASLDLFPAQVIDRLVVSKTFTPDQPGTYTGGGIDILTKSFPERPFFSFSAGGSYNPNVNLNDKFLTYDGGGLDWFSMDDGSRKLPQQLEGVDIPPKPESVNLTHPPSDVVLTNLSNARLLNRFTRAMPPTQFAPERKAPPFNHNFSAAGGGTAFMLGRPLGVFAGMSYKKDYSFFEDGTSRRHGGGPEGTEVRSDYNDSRALSVGNWSAMLNLAYQPIDNHELGFTYFYNQNAIDDVRFQNQGFEGGQTGLRFRKYNLYWTERNLNTYQIKGDHRLPEVGDIKFDWLVALTQTTQDEPNARFFNEFNAGEGWETGGNNVPTPSQPTQYFRELDEHNKNVRLNWTIPFHTWHEEDGFFKFGLFDSDSDRTFTDRQLSWFGDFVDPNHPDDPGGYGGDPNRFLNRTNRGLLFATTNVFRGRTNITYTWGRYLENFDSLYNAKLNVQAGYLMLDLPVLPNLRLVGGARYEATEMSIYSETYRDNTITGERTNNTSIAQYDVLPSAAVILSLKKNMNFRLSWSKTLARPSFRELAAYFSYDPTINDFIDGNPELQMTAIDNYDFRWEWFPRPGEIVSVSLFYKDLENAIERGDVTIVGDSISFFNREQAKLYGIEFEARKNLDFLSYYLRHFSLGGNLSLIQSEVELTKDELAALDDLFKDPDKKRPLYDQSPYIANVDLSYGNPFSGTIASLLFNVAGERIALTKLNAEDVYEQPAPALDFLISQKIGRHMTLRFSVRNLLDPKIERTYGKEGKLLYDSYRRGRTFGFSVSYDF